MYEYILELHTAKHYAALAITTQSIFAPLSERLARWADQDGTHADLFYENMAGDEMIAAVSGALPVFQTDYIGDNDMENHNDKLAVMQSIAQDVQAAEAFKADVFRSDYMTIAKISSERARVMKTFLSRLEKGWLATAFGATVVWECANCGYIISVESDQQYNNTQSTRYGFAPQQCPCCEATQESFIRHHPITGW